MRPAANAADSSYVSRSIAAGGSRWVVDATRLVGAGAGTLTANAYCAAVPKVKNRSASTAVVAPTGSRYTATIGKCPNKLSTRGGGFATSSPVGGLANAALVLREPPRRSRLELLGHAQQRHHLDHAAHGGLLPLAGGLGGR